MANCMMNLNEENQQNLILAHQFKRQEQQEESIYRWSSLSPPSRPKGMSSFSCLWNNENDKILDLINILDETEKIFDQKQGSRNKHVKPTPSPKQEDPVAPSTNPYILLEPTPFGPQGIQPQSVVNEIPLIKSGKLLLENNHKDQEALFSALHPLLPSTEKGGHVSEKQHYKNTRHRQAQKNLIEEDTNMVKHASGDTVFNGTCFTAFSPVDIPVNANSSTSGDEDFCADDNTEVSDLKLPHSSKRKFRPTEEEYFPFSKCFLPMISTSSGSPSKKQRNMEYLTFDSFSESTTTFSSPAAVAMTFLDDGTFVDQTYHQEGQQHYQNDSSSLVLNDHTSDSSSCSSSATTTTASTSDERRFRPYQCDQWKERFQDLADFKAQHGHCLVPYDFPSNQHLSEWIKRQRYQYKQKNLGGHSTLTDERQLALEQIGFVWDSHKAAWMEHFESLKEFKARYGNCLVPSKYIDRSLAVWVKCQRRQYKLFLKGQKSAMTQERFSLLESVGFDWNPRNLK